MIGTTYKLNVRLNRHGYVVAKVVGSTLKVRQVTLMKVVDDRKMIDIQVPD